MNLHAELYYVETSSRDGSPSETIAVLLVNRPEHWEFTRLGDWLYRERTLELSVCDAVIVRQPPDKLEVFSDSGRDIVSDLMRRVSEKPIHILGIASGQHALGENLNRAIRSRLSGVEQQDFINALRNKELLNIAHRTSAIFCARPRVFRSPSKMYAEHFMRAGNVQKSRAILDTFYFWLLPSLRTTTAVLLRQE